MSLWIRLGNHTYIHTYRVVAMQLCLQPQNYLQQETVEILIIVPGRPQRQHAHVNVVSVFMNRTQPTCLAEDRACGMPLGGEYQGVLRRMAHLNRGCTLNIVSMNNNTDLLPSMHLYGVGYCYRMQPPE